MKYVPNISTPLINVIEKTNFTFPFSSNILDFLVLSDCTAKSMLKYFPSHTKLLFKLVLFIIPNNFEMTIPNCLPFSTLYDGGI